jgi:hypothetical protein
MWVAGLGRSALTALPFVGAGNVASRVLALLVTRGISRSRWAGAIKIRRREPLFLEMVLSTAAIVGFESRAVQLVG